MSRLDDYRKAFDISLREYRKAVERFGLEFAPFETSPRTVRRELSQRCELACENGDASIRSGWISPACLACRRGERTRSFFIDLRCPRNCYFCFNPNQEYFEYFQTHRRNVTEELEALSREGEPLDCIALTGGEPLLYPEEAVAFFATARTRFPQAHTRLYTSGSGLDAPLIDRLASAGLDEIRFSVKPEGIARDQERILHLMQQSIGRIPTVMLEVPVIPGQKRELLQLLERLDRLGIQGVNLLEFCFPLCNAEEFRKRGFRLRARPFAYLYDYWYGGGLPIEGSEADALSILEHAKKAGWRMGVHYCSSDNKNTGQLFQQNKPFLDDPALRTAYPWLRFDEETCLLSCARVFTDALEKLDSLLESARIPHEVHPESGSLIMPEAALGAIGPASLEMEIAKSLNVLEEDEAGELHLREIDCVPIG